MSAAQSALLLTNLTSEALLIVVCCNGGLPFVDLHVWPADGASFDALDLTDWVATATSGDELNKTVHPEVASWLDPMGIPDDVNLDYCDMFNLTFASTTSKDLFSNRNGSLSCRCARNYYGDRCQLHSSPLTSNGEQSFKIFIYLAIIPLLALGAAVTFFLCKQCCCDCFGFNCVIQPCCTESGDDDWRGSKYELEPLDDNTLNRCLEAVKASEQRHRTFPMDTNHTERQPCMLDVEQVGERGGQAEDVYLGQARSRNQFLPTGSTQPPFTVHSSTKCSPPPAYRPKASPPNSRPNSIDATTQTSVIFHNN